MYELYRIPIYRLRVTVNCHSSLSPTCSHGPCSHGYNCIHYTTIVDTYTELHIVNYIT